MLEFNSETHTYKLDNVKIPSVTQIIGGAGLSDFSKVNPELLERAKKFGSAAHLACQLFDENRLDMKSLDPALEPRLESWILFKRDFGITEFKEIEKQVYSTKYQYAGCLDRLTIINNELTLIEIKTTSIMPKTTKLQLAGYLIAFNEGKKFNEKIKNRIAVRLKGNGSYNTESYNDNIDISAFLGALALINWKKINNIT